LLLRQLDLFLALQLLELLDLTLQRAIPLVLGRVLFSTSLLVGGVQAIGLAGRLISRSCNHSCSVWDFFFRLASFCSSSAFAF
jgi:hypothetical protein